MGGSPGCPEGVDGPRLSIIGDRMTSFVVQGSQMWVVVKGGIVCELRDRIVLEVRIASCDSGGVDVEERAIRKDCQMSG